MISTMKKSCEIVLIEIGNIMNMRGLGGGGKSGNWLVNRKKPTARMEKTSCVLLHGRVTADIIT